MGRSATPESCVGFVCPNSHLCCSENEQWQVYYPRTYFPTRKQMASDLLSESHLKRKRKTNKGAFWANLTNNKMIQSLWCPSGALASNFFGWLIPLVFFTSFSTFLVRLLPQVDFGLFLYLYLYLFLPCLHVQLLKDMCTSSLDCWIHYGWWKLAEE